MTSATTTGPACLARVPREDAGLRLFCFHHAGGGASFFASWPAWVAPGVDVLPVQLPGRESRFRERRFRDARTLAEALERELAPWLERPYAFYGHSMGALVAFAVAAARMRSAGRPPRMLYVGAYGAPHLTPALPEADEYADGELARFLVDIGGLSPQFLGREEWLRALLPIIRDDLRICASHRRAGLPDPDDEEARLPLDIHAFAGRDDRLVDPGAVWSWEQYARRFHMSTVAGGHFFPREEPEPFFGILNRSLTALVTERGGSRGAPG